MERKCRFLEKVIHFDLSLGKDPGQICAGGRQNCPEGASSPAAL